MIEKYTFPSFFPLKIYSSRLLKLPDKFLCGKNYVRLTHYFTHFSYYI
jgi:hypothetical protein